MQLVSQHLPLFYSTTKKTWTAMLIKCQTPPPLMSWITHLRFKPLPLSYFWREKKLVISLYMGNFSHADCRQAEFSQSKKPQPKRSLILTEIYPKMLNCANPSNLHFVCLCVLCVCVCAPNWIFSIAPIPPICIDSSSSPGLHNLPTVSVNDSKHSSFKKFDHISIAGNSKWHHF